MRRLATANASNAAEQAGLAMEIGANFTADAISRDVVGEWLLSLAGKKLGFSST